MNYQLCVVGVALVSVIVVSPHPQVNQEIDREDDLLAVDSFRNKISVPILPPPPAFAGRGERLTQGPRQPVARAGGSRDVRTLVFNNKMNDDGSYAFNYETSDGQSRREQGEVGVDGGFSQTGGWEYVGADGQTYRITFVADENGFRPVGPHIPTNGAANARQSRVLRPSSSKKSPSRQNSLTSNSRRPASRTERPALREGRPAFQEFRPASREVRPASREVRPASREVRPASREVRPASREVRPASRNGRPVPREGRPAFQEVRPFVELRPASRNARPGSRGSVSRDRPPVSRERPVGSRDRQPVSRDRPAVGRERRPVSRDRLPASPPFFTTSRGALVQRPSRQLDQDRAATRKQTSVAKRPPPAQEKVKVSFGAKLNNDKKQSRKSKSRKGGRARGTVKRVRVKKGKGPKAKGLPPHSFTK